VSFVRATYYVETPLTLEAAAEALASEQSTGTFIAVPLETAELKARYRARIERIELIETRSRPTLPGSRPASGSYQCGFVELAFPLENMGCNLPTLMATLAGNLFELSELSAIRLVDLDLPDEFAQAYTGPRFGIQGTRDIAQVYDRPLIGTIIKPSVGLSPEQTAVVVRELVEAGIDFIKDDELMANPPHNPLPARARAVMRVIRDYADRTGKYVIYAFNISDRLEDMIRHIEILVEEGARCCMVSLNWVGIAAFDYLRRNCPLIIHGHRNGWGMMTRAPGLGMDFRAYQKIWRLAGVDHLHVNGLANKFWEPDDSVVRSIHDMLQPLFGGYFAMPVISSGQWGGQAPDTYRRCRTIDLLYLAGGGIFAHPHGVAAGIRAIREAWEAAVAGISLAEYAQTHPDLAAALHHFGTARRGR
jgi:ribulose-bisphosphate carboxylase large chain